MKIKKNIPSTTQVALVDFQKDGKNLIFSDPKVDLEVDKGVTQVGNLRASLVDIDKKGNVTNPVPEKIFKNKKGIYVGYDMKTYKKYIADRKTPHKYYGNIISDARKVGMPLKVSFVNVPNNKIIHSSKGEIWFKGKGKGNIG